MVACNVSLPVRLIDYGLRDYKIGNQIGLEQTPEEYASNLVAVFREVWRVLTDDGVVYLNLGDSYAGSGCGTNDYRTEASRSINKTDVMFSKNPPQQKLKQYGYKPKDLLGIPWMVAFALRTDGWYLRDDIIWVKGYSGNIRGGSTMPESVKDRCTKSYEHIFMLTKQPKYFYDYYATLEPSVSNVTLNKKSSEIRQAPKAAAVDYKGSPMFRNGHHNDNLPSNSSMSNPRNVWIINPKPFKGAHYATFPPELVRLPILAGTSEKGHCPKCGARWERVITKGGKRITEAMINAGCDKDGNYDGTSQKDYANNKAQDASETKKRILKSMSAVYNYQWQPTCNCGLKPVPDIVLDPFCGSGTTVMVAKELGREAIGLDLSFQYLHTIAKERIGIL